jgi:hypothetical protein
MPEIGDPPESNPYDGVNDEDEKENTMTKLFAAVGIGTLALLLGLPAVMSAQDDKPQDAPKAEPKGDEARPPKQDEVKPPKAGEEKPARPEDNRKPEDARQQDHPEQQARPDEHAARPAGGRIPDDKFRAQFGRQHTVVIRQPVIVEGQPRFQFGGYWFVIADPWPGDWAYSDNCYIDYVDGAYFLFDLRHPGMRIALTVVM